MSAPVINGVTVTYPGTQTSAQPGQQVRLTVDATDADNYTITVNVTVKDAAGNQTAVASSVTVSDPLTYSATASAGTITQDPVNPNQFVLTVPA